MLEAKTQQILNILGLTGQNNLDFWSPLIQIDIKTNTAILDFVVVKAQRYISPKSRYLLLNLK